MIKYQEKKKKKRGFGLLNKVINKLPFELHLPGYQYCGPGTKLAKRLARGDPGINPLDVACKEHDIAYSQNREDVASRNVADRVLAAKAWERFRAVDAGIGEKAAAWTVSKAMKLKSRFGMGLPKMKKSSKNKRKKKKRRVSKKNKRRFSTLSSIIKAASKPGITNKSGKSVISSALKAAKAAVKLIGGKKNVKVPRILPVSSKIGGFLPFLIPLFAGLSATGALAGGAAGIAKAINSSKAAQQQLEESQRHNRTIEAIALGKGVYLKPYKKGYGLFLKPYSGAGLKKKKRSK